VGEILNAKESRQNYFISTQKKNITMATHEQEAISQKRNFEKD